MQIGFGKKYKTINPLVLLARRNRKLEIQRQHYSFDNEENDYNINSVMKFSSMDRHFFGYNIYKATFLSNKLYQAIYNVFDFQSDIKYKIQIRSLSLHKLKILNVPAWSWRDCDERMFHACFSLLGQFVEKELGLVTAKNALTNPNEQHRGYNFIHKGNEAIIDLWLWYKLQLPIEQKISNDYYDDKLPKDSIAYQKHKEDFDYLLHLKDTKFNELMALRRSLWT
jgi:hypothetical protein